MVLAGPAPGTAQPGLAAAAPPAAAAAPGPAAPGDAGPLRPEPGRLGFVLQISRFPWGDDPAAWLAAVTRAAAEAGFEGVALMDHLIQIPQVGPGLGADPRAVRHPRPAGRPGHRACGWARWSRR